MRSYRILALIGTFLKIIGWLTVIGTVLGSCSVLIFGVGGLLAVPGLTGQELPVGGLAAGVVGQVVAAVVVLILGLVYGAIEIASGELIELFIDLSTSSQRTVQLLERMVTPPMQPQRPLPAPATQPSLPGQ